MALRLADSGTCLAARIASSESCWRSASLPCFSSPESVLLACRLILSRMLPLRTKEPISCFNSEGLDARSDLQRSLPLKWRSVKHQNEYPALRCRSRITEGEVVYSRPLVDQTASREPYIESPAGQNL